MHFLSVSWLLQETQKQGVYCGSIKNFDDSNDDDDNNDVLAGERGTGGPTANKWEEKKCPRWHQVNYWTRDDDDEYGDDDADDDDDAGDWTMTPSIGLDTLMRVWKCVKLRPLSSGGGILQIKVILTNFWT